MSIRSASGLFLVSSKASSATVRSADPIKPDETLPGRVVQNTLDTAPILCSTSSKILGSKSDAAENQATQQIFDGVHGSRFSCILYMTLVEVRLPC